MSPAEVFAVEVKQYVAEGHDGTVIVPAVYGRTATASAKSISRRPVDREAAIAASKPATLRPPCDYLRSLLRSWASSCTSVQAGFF